MGYELAAYRDGLGDIILPIRPAPVSIVSGRYIVRDWMCVVSCFHREEIFIG